MCEKYYTLSKKGVKTLELNTADSRKMGLLGRHTERTTAGFQAELKLRVLKCRNLTT